MNRDEARRIRNARVLGLAFCVAGFAAIGLGWHGMARVACPDCQLPYLLSGGVAGLAMVVLGAGLIVAAQMTAERLKMQSVLERVTGIFAQAGNGNGSSKTHDEVVAGGSSYHRPDCRLVATRDGLRRMPVDVARAAGLDPCRLCMEPQPATN